ncbi:XPG/Rad2 endonuclease, partial [Abortiporus biennis]
MGVEGLWKLIEEARDYRGSLQMLAFEDGFRDTQIRPAIIGIDASIWIYQASKSLAVEHPQAGLNPALRSFFYRLLELLEAPFIPLLVFDGPERPEKKRGLNVSPVPHYMVHHCIKLINACKFYYHQAPGEAEAELAMLNKIGVIDAVMTEDSDVFVFGARTVLRRTSASNATIASIDRYSAGRIPQLQTPDFVLIALMSGCDYDETGVPGCGTRTAQGLTRYGLGRSLCRAALDLSGIELETFTINWRIQVINYLANDPSDFIGRHNPALAHSLPTTFPNMKIVMDLLRPKTSPTIPFFRDSFSLRLPDLPLITQFCEQLFQWDDMVRLLGTYKNRLWPGLVTRILALEAIRVTSSANAKDERSSVCEQPMFTVRLCNVSKDSFDDDAEPSCKVSIVPKMINDIAVTRAVSSIAYTERNVPIIPPGLPAKNDPTKPRQYTLPLLLFRRARAAAIAQLLPDHIGSATII